LYSLPASPKANKQESVLDPSFTLQTTHSASDWADTYALLKAKPSIMPVKKWGRNIQQDIFCKSSVQITLSTPGESRKRTT
jgi:hypothetical protein